MEKADVITVIFIVEADESVKQGLARLMESAGLEARPCGCIEDLLRQARAEPAACALLDLPSPDLKDAALWSRLRDVAAALPVIALSVRDDTRVRHMARQLGAKAFFRKPVDAAALLDAIDWVTRKSDPRYH